MMRNRPRSRARLTSLPLAGDAPGQVRRFWLLVSTGSALLTLLGGGPLEAQRASGANGEVPRAASAVINTTMSPYCPGLLLSNCPSPAADSLRRAIVARAQRGAGERELRADLVAAYGAGVLAEPPMRGLGLFAWVAPFALLAAAGVGVSIWIRRQHRLPDAHGVGTAVASTAVADAADLRPIEDLVRGRP